MGKKIEVSIPETIDDLTISQYRGYLRVSEIEDGPERLLKQVAALLGIELSIVMQIEPMALLQIFGGLQQIMTKPDRTLLKYRVEIGGKMHGFIPELDDLTLGEFVDLEHYMDDPEVNLEALCCILFRPIVDDDDDYAIEPYTGAMPLNKTVNMSYGQAIAAVDKYSQWRHKTLSNFGQLFEGGGGDSNEVGAKWGWYGTIHHLAGGNVLKIDETTRIPLLTALTMMCYEQDLDRMQKVSIQA